MPSPLLVRRALLFYLGLLSLGIVLANAFDVQPILFFPLKPGSPPLYFQLIFAVIVAGATSVWGLWLSSRSRAGSSFEEFLQSIFSSLHWMDAVTLALLSGIAEEWLFRSVGVPLIGVWWSSLIFAAVHIPPKKELWFWPLSAFLLGVLFAWWTAWSDSVLGATLAHGLINGFTLVRLTLRKKETP